MLLQSLVDTSERVGATPRKKEKTSLLAQCFRQSEGREIVLAVSYLSGQVPQGRLGIGWATLQQALQGISQQPKSIALLDVDRCFEDIDRISGTGALARKISLLQNLFSALSERERTFLIRLITGEIRQGALEGLVLDAIAQASSLPVERVRRALMFTGEIGEVARAALEEGASGLSRFQPRLFQPISPMLASAAEGEEDALSRLGEAAWEYKIDGARIQVHKKGEEVRIYTRHLKEVTNRVPEIGDLVRPWPLEEAVFEGETIALREDGRPQPFQTTMRRFGRILDVEAMGREIPLTSYFFDLLYLEGEPLFEKPYRTRFGLLAERIPSAYTIPRIVTSN